MSVPGNIFPIMSLFTLKSPLTYSMVVFGLFVGLIFAQGTKQSDDFVEVITLDKTIVVELPYATKNNFTKTKLYNVERCFLRKEVAKALVAAHQSLKKQGLGLKIWDGYRPRSVQRKMFEIMPQPGYVSDPVKGSNHNRGAAVDVTLIRLDTKKELKMPTKYDSFEEKAHTNNSNHSSKVIGNRTILQETMRAHGFTTIRKEWWHFNYKDASKFPLEEISLAELAGEKIEKKKKEE